MNMFPSTHEDDGNPEMQKEPTESEIDVDMSADDDISGGGDQVQPDDTSPTRKPSATDFSTHFVIHRKSQTQLSDNDETTHPPGIGKEDVDIVNLPSSSSCEASSAMKDDADGDTTEGSNSGACTLPTNDEDKVSPPDKGESTSIQAPSPIPITSTPIVAAVGRRTSPRFQHPFMNPKFSPIMPKISEPTKPSVTMTMIKMPSSPMDSTYEPIFTYCIQDSSIEQNESKKCSDDLAGKTSLKTPMQQTLEVCEQRRAIPLTQIFKDLQDLKKIGEGVYGEVYSGTFRCLTEFSWVYKIVAIEGDALVNGERQRKFLEILPEIVISQKLNQLRSGLSNCQTDGYVHMRNARIATGQYPQRLVQSWEKYNEEYDSDNDKPNFPRTQVYMVLEFEFAGEDIEAVVFKDACQSLSIVLQVAHILAIGESALEFEHRDLHWGNVMVKSYKSPDISFILNGETLLVPSRGVKVAVIDFTMSRLKDAKTSEIICLDLEDDEEQFLGTGDHQFDIYRMMRDFNRNEWQKYCPKSNVFWLHYLAHKFSVKGNYKDRTKDGAGEGDDISLLYHREALKMLLDFSYSILECESASDFVLSDACKMYKKFLTPRF